MEVLMRVPARIRGRTHTCTCVRVYACTYAHTRECVHVHLRMSVHVHALAPMRAYAPICEHMHACACCAHVCACMGDAHASLTPSREQLRRHNSIILCVAPRSLPSQRH